MKRTLGLALPVLAAGALLVWWHQARPASQPGPIVLVSIDTLRADRLPSYGYRKVETPAIDALAADGVLFERAYSHSPQTLPSHTSLFTGRLPFEHGVRDNVGFTIRPDEWLLPAALRERGYATLGVVSAYVLRNETGIGRGFDRFDSQFPPASPEMGFGQVQRDGADSLAIADRWLDEMSSDRLFLFLHVYEPHKPYAPPPRYAQYDPYDGEVAYADELVGRLVESLRQRDLYESSTIVLLSDHGEGLGDHGELEHGVFLYDESIRIPLIVKMPDGRGAGTRVAQPVQHIDLVPTLLELTGAAPRPGLRGRSLAPLLAGDGTIEPDRAIYSEALYPRYHFGWSELYALTDARYRFIKAPQDELYDLQQDPGERQNIIDSRPDAQRAARTALDQILSGSRIDAPSRVSDADRDRLQALGYVGGQATITPEQEAAGLPDPKDKIDVLERYRRAVDLAGGRQFAESVHLFRQILAENPAMKDVWLQLANVLVRSGRIEESVEAHKRFLEMNPEDAYALIGAAAGLLKLRRLDEAEAHADLATRVAPEQDLRVRATAYELLAKIALARKDGATALRHARKAQDADPTLPLPAYIQGLMLHTAGQYGEALRHLEDAERQLSGRTMTLTELHFYLGDTLARLGRNAEAEAHFREELRLFPQNTRAYSGLAMLYRSTGRDRESEAAIAALIQAVPTPEGYELAARLWSIFGEPARANAVRALARR